MKRITLFLTFDDQAEEAASFYTSVFESSKIVSRMRRPDGTLMAVQFQLDGQGFVALNGGPTLASSKGVALLVNCKAESEIDELWEKLSSGGEKQPCGRVRDRFGVSWQVVSPNLGMLRMSKFVIMVPHAEWITASRLCPSGSSTSAP